MEVVAAIVLADDHPRVDRIARADEHPAARLQIGDCVGHRRALPIADQRAGGPRAEVTLVRIVSGQVRVHDAGAACIGEEFGTVADQPTGRDAELQLNSSRRVVGQSLQAALPAHQLLGDDAGVGVATVDREMLDRLQAIAVLHAKDHLWPADAQLEPFAAHRLDEDGELELAAPLDQQAVVTLDLFDFDGDVLQRLAVQAVANLAHLHDAAFLARKRGGVLGKAHRYRRLVHHEAGQGHGRVSSANGIADVDLVDPRQHRDVAGLRRLGAHQRHALVHLDAGYAQRLFRIGADSGESIARRHPPRVDLADREPSQVVGIPQVGDQHAERLGGIGNRCRDFADDGIEQRVQVLLRPIDGGLGDAVPAGRVEDRQIELVLMGVEVDQQCQDLVHHLRRPRVGPVDLVDDEDQVEAELERLAEHEAGLRQRSLGRIHQHDGAVHHRKRPLHLAAEIGVPRCVDDVDLDAAPAHRAVLGGDGDAAFPLQVHAIHHAFGDDLSLPEHPATAEHRVHERGLAVVDVGDDRGVANLVVAELLVHALGTNVLTAAALRQARSRQ